MKLHPGVFSFLLAHHLGLCSAVQPGACFEVFGEGPEFYPDAQPVAPDDLALDLDRFLAVGG